MYMLLLQRDINLLTVGSSISSSAIDGLNIIYNKLEVSLNSNVLITLTCVFLSMLNLAVSYNVILCMVRPVSNLNKGL